MTVRAHLVPSNVVAPHKTSRRCAFWLAMVLVVLSFLAARTTYADQSISYPNLVDLTPSERAWIDQHPTLHVAIPMGDQLPAESWVAGRAEGIGVDYVRLLAARLGLQLEIAPMASGVNTSGANDTPCDNCDLILGVRQIDGAYSAAQYLPPYLSGHFMLVARKGDQQIRTQNDLVHARIVIARGFPWLTNTLTQRFPGATLLFADDETSAIDMVSSNAADAFIGVTQAQTQMLIRRRANNDVSMLSELDLPMVHISLEVPSRHEELFQLLLKADRSITAEERERLSSRWEGNVLPAGSKPHVKALNAQELSWLSQLKPLRLGYEADRYPYSFTNASGKLDGIAAEYLHAAQEKLGLRIELVPARDWSELERMVKAKEVDIIAASTPADFLSSDMTFTQAYEHFPAVIVAKTDGRPVLRVADLAGRPVAARDEAGLIGNLRRLMPYSQIIPVASNEAGLAAVTTGDVDAFIGTLPPVDSLLRDRYVGKLNVVAPVGMDQDLSFGVSKELAPLAHLIDRALSDVTDEQRRAIASRWLHTEYNYGVPVHRVVLGSMAILSALALVSLAYVRLRRILRDKHRVERELASQLALRTAILESIPYPIFVKDHECRYIAVNKAYEAMFRCQSGELIGRNSKESEHLAAMDPEEIHAADLMVLESGRSVKREERVLAGNGSSSRSVLLWVHRIEGVSEAGPGLLGTFVDVSDLRQAEERAEALEQRVKEIGATLPGSFFQMESTGDGRHRFNYLAGDTNSLVGMTQDAIADNGAVLFERIHPEDREAAERLISLAILNNLPIGTHDFRMNVNGEWRWLRAEGGRPRAMPGGLMQWTGYCVDTTDFHEQQRELSEAKMRAEDAVAAKGVFLAMMSHEIRTPMVGVMGLIELMKSQSTQEKQARMLEYAYDSASTLLQILDDILDYSRIESGRMALESVPVNLRTLADGVLALFSPIASEKHLRLNLKVDWRLSIRHFGDPIRIRQILTNLVSNAVKFTNIGSLDVCVDLVEHVGNEQRIRISVHDTGIGIAPDQLEQLFHPFTQAEISTTRRFGGSGLGLAISQRLANLMGGTLTLKSTLALGTSAYLDVVLPIAPTEADHYVLNGKLVALSVQDPWSRRDLSNILSSLGAQVIEIEPGDTMKFNKDEAVALWVGDANADDKHLPTGDVPRLLVLDQRGAASSDGEIGYPVIHGNPFSWTSMMEACQVALKMSAQKEDECMNNADTMSPARILLAEDNPVNRLVISEQLLQLGFACDVAEDGVIAWSALEAGNYGLLITDSRMPLIDGLALTHMVRHANRESLRMMPIIVVSASVSDEHSEQLLASGASEVMAKPTTLDGLKDAIARYLDQPHE